MWISFCTSPQIIILHYVYIWHFDWCNTSSHEMMFYSSLKSLGIYDVLCYNIQGISSRAKKNERKFFYRKHKKNESFGDFFFSLLLSLYIHFFLHLIGVYFILYFYFCTLFFFCTSKIKEEHSSFNIGRVEI